MLAFNLFLSLILVTFFTSSAHLKREDEKYWRAGIERSRSPEDLLLQMTLDEKISLMAGDRGSYTGNIAGIDRLSIPPLYMQDGPQGFRTTPTTGGDGTSTAWPSTMTIASSFDSELVYRWAAAMAGEYRLKGANMHLGPGLGIARVPIAGRNFEYLCGEDPMLGARLVGSVIKGMQDNKIIANAKHWVNNEIENHRMLVSANVNERTRFELYYPPFEAAAEAGVLSVMCSYNRINDVYACQNNETLSHLRNDLGFTGWVVSDWTATKSTAQSLSAGLDVEMPYGLFYNKLFLQAKLASKDISLEQIDTAVLRILSSMDKMGFLDEDYKLSGDPTANVTSDEHNALAREIAGKSTVLLQNAENVLPLKSSADSLGSCIAVIGDQSIVSGAGSGHVNPPYVITASQGISNYLLSTGNSATEVITSDGSDMEEVKRLAGKCAFSVVSVAVISSEGSDRSTLALGNNQDELISAVASVAKRTIVVMNIPGAVLMPWKEEVQAIVVAWMPGQEWGNALAQVLFGEVNPSARTPVTIPNKDNEVCFSREQYPGKGFPPEAVYSEELLLGYRWYDAKNVEPVFPFGHGLSYSSFEYSDLTLQAKEGSVDASLRVKNNGSLDGDEIVQLYLGFPSEAKEPPKQLRAFAKVHVNAQQESSVTLHLSPRDLSIWSDGTDGSNKRGWTVLPGTYSIYIGASSRDIRLTAQFTM